jgi:hypothetical protein
MAGEIGAAAVAMHYRKPLCLDEVNSSRRRVKFCSASAAADAACTAR